MAHPAYLGPGLHPQEIRLLRLFPASSWLDEIYCELFPTSLNNKPVYKALSYAWGLSKASRPILLNGHKYLVTPNLESALRRLRGKRDELVLWIDAICINQLSNDERSHQVSLMRDIFLTAKEVYAHVGDGLDNSDDQYHKYIAALGLMPLCAFYGDEKDDEYDQVLLGTTSTSDSKRRKSLVQPLRIYTLISRLARADHFTGDTFGSDDENRSMKCSLFEGLRIFLRCRWWSRIWIVQEVVVPSRINLVYGSAMAPWLMFAQAAANWIKHSASCCTEVSQHLPVEYGKVLGHFCQTVQSVNLVREEYRILSTAKNGGVDITPLVSYLRRFRNREASDPRDKIYALLALLPNEATRALIAPDYSLSVAEVFQKSAITIIQCTRSLSIITGDLGVQRKYRQDLPSWTPDWSAPGDLTGTYSGLYNAAPLTKANITANNHSLGVKGRDLARIAQVSAVMPAEPQIAWSTIMDWSFVARQKPLKLEVKAGAWTHDSQAFWRTLLADVLNVSSRKIRATTNHQLWIVLWIWTLCPVTARESKEWSRPTSVEARWEEVLRYLVSFNRLFTGEHPSRPNFISKSFLWDILALDENDILLPSQTSELPLLEQDSEWGLYSFKGKMFMFDVLEQCRDWLAEVFAAVDSSVRSATASRRLFITDNYVIGLGPSECDLGHSVTILEGAETPVVLKHVGWNNSGGEYVHKLVVVGDCYMHGFMDGQALEPSVGLNNCFELV